jgi:hypothetical protein
MKIDFKNALNLTRQLQALDKMLKESPGPYPFTVYEELRRIELKANRLAAIGCERELTEKEIKLLDRIEKKVKGMFKPEFSKNIFINMDPRGYALKIKSRKPENISDEIPGLWYDWGKYGILAPEF